MLELHFLFGDVGHDAPMRGYSSDDNDTIRESSALITFRLCPPPCSRDGWIQLCNCFGQSLEWSVDESLRLPVGTALELCLQLLGSEDHKPPRDSAVTADHTMLLPEHLLVGLGLAHNLALHPWVSGWICFGLLSNVVCHE